MSAATRDGLIIVTCSPLEISRHSTPSLPNSKSLPMHSQTMKTAHIVLLVLLGAGFIRARAQDNPAPAPAAEPAQTEMQKWIATTDAQWQAVFNREVTDVHAAEFKDLALKYAVLLDAGIAKVSAAGDLKDALVLRDEKKRFADTNVFPEKDEDGDAASVKAIRAAIRVQLAKLETASGARTKAVHAKYDAVLAQAQTQLTQRQRLDDALLVKAKREEVSAAWLAGIPAAPAPQPSPTVQSPKVSPVIPKKPDSGTARTNPAMLDEALAQKITTAISTNTMQRLGPVGPQGEGRSDLPKDGAVLVGFEYNTGKWKGDPMVKSMRPLFLTTTGVVSGSGRGNPDQPYKVIKARAGYAVSGLIVNPGKERLGGFQMVFSRMQKRPIGSSEPDSYKSEWVAGEIRKGMVVLGEEGRLAIGIFGGSGADVGSIGLIVAP